MSLNRRELLGTAGLAGLLPVFVKRPLAALDELINRYEPKYGAAIIEEPTPIVPASEFLSRVPANACVCELRFNEGKRWTVQAYVTSVTFDIEAPCGYPVCDSEGLPVLGGISTGMEEVTLTLRPIGAMEIIH